MAEDEKKINKSEAAERIRRLKKSIESRSIAGAGDEVPYAWRNPLVTLDKRKMTKVLRTIKQGDEERSQYLPALAERE